MANCDSSYEIVPESPDNVLKSNIKLGKKQDNFSLNESAHCIFVPDSEEENDVSSNIDTKSLNNLNEKNEKSSDKSCILSSDLDESISSPTPLNKFKISSINKSNSTSIAAGMGSSTPFSSPAFQTWRNVADDTRKSENCSDNNSPFIRKHDGRARAQIITSDTDSDKSSRYDETDDELKVGIEVDDVYESPLSKKLSYKRQEKNRKVKSPEFFNKRENNNSDEHISIIKSVDNSLIKIGCTNKMKSRKTVICSDSESESEDSVDQKSPYISQMQNVNENSHRVLNLSPIVPSPLHNINSVSPLISSEKDSKNGNQEFAKLYNGKYKIKPRNKSIEIQDSSPIPANNSSTSTKNDLTARPINISTASSNSSNVSIDITDTSASEIRAEIKNKKALLRTANVSYLPDGGAKIKEKIALLEDVLSNLSIKESNDILTVKKHSPPDSSDSSIKNSSNKPETSSLSKLTELERLKQELAQKQRVYKASNLRALPDGGQSLKRSIALLEKDIMMLSLKADAAAPFEQHFVPKYSTKKASEDGDERKVKLVDEPTLAKTALGLAMEASAKSKGLSKGQLSSLYDVQRNYAGRDYGGKLSSGNARRMFEMTSEAVDHLHASLRSMPDVDVEEEQQPAGIKVDLMPHQKRGLKWLLWRESQMPPGGILADDMGLGKTLLMLSLTMRHRELRESGAIRDDEECLDGSNGRESDSGWLSKEGRKLAPSRGTLIVCPASLLGQWEGEIQKRVSRNRLTSLVYHGSQRNISVSRLSKYDVVITTYNLVANEAFPGSSKSKSGGDKVPEIDFSQQGLVFRVGWTRIILDEAHVIRNHKTKASQAVCMLRGGRRWAVSGTPVQNKEMDFYSLVRFLRLSPFDDYTCWKHQIKTSSANAMQKLNLIVKGILLRRTKDQIDKATGKPLVFLPAKNLIEHRFELTDHERVVYDRVFAFSRTSLIEYMKSQDEKEKEKANKLGQSFKPHQPFSDKPSDYKYTPTLPGELFQQELKVHHMLVLLLRLRQICCHPALIEAMIEEESRKEEGLEADEDLVSKLTSMCLSDESSKATAKSSASEGDPVEEVLTKDNPIFKKRFCSSKIDKVITELEAIQRSGGREKAVVVSQWTSMLEILHRHLRKAHLSVSAITGNVPIKERASIVDEFNTPMRGPQVLLLSLLAGGVGLNLVGANHLFLIDCHWNPQLEVQACDRIYRVGQVKDVQIHRFVVKNSIEEKILELQAKKMEIADAVLTGAKRTVSSKLTLHDIKTLFSIT